MPRHKKTFANQCDFLANHGESFISSIVFWGGVSTACSFVGRRCSLQFWAMVINLCGFQRLSFQQRGDVIVFYLIVFAALRCCGVLLMSGFRLWGDDPDFLRWFFTQQSYSRGG